MRYFGTSCPNAKVVLTVVTILLVAAAAAAEPPGSWAAKTDLPENLFFAATAEVNGIIYVIGGSPGAELVGTVYAYDPHVGSTSKDLSSSLGFDVWLTKTTMPTPRMMTAAAVVNGKIYVIGGARTTMTIASNYIDAYDPDLYTYWTEVTAHLDGAHGSQWRTDLCAANFNGETANVELVLHADTGDVRETYTIDPSQQKSFADVVGNMGVEGKGTLEFRADQHLRMAGRTFNEGDNGTFGQFCDFRPMDDGFFTDDDSD